MDTDTRETEAKSSSAKFTWRGFDFEVPTIRDDWSVDFVESLEEGKAVGIVRGALGPRQWPMVKGMNLKISDLEDLSAAIAKAMGFGSTGESPASSS